MTADATIQVVRQLQTELDVLKTSLSHKFGVEMGKTAPTVLPNGCNIDQLIYIRFAYGTVLLSLHTVLTYPWMRSLLDLGSDDKYRDTINHSSEIAAQASCDIILMTEHIRFAAYTTVP
jgi:hypothetical protein